MAGKLKKGIVQVYTGNGKGKTTAAFGQAVRALGAGLEVSIVQFLKDSRSSEVQAVLRAMPEIKVYCFGRTGFVHPFSPSDEDVRQALRGLEKCREILEHDCPDVLVLDEICTAVSLGLIGEDAVLRFLQMRPGNVEFVLTGRKATPGIIGAADLVTEMREVKHPFSLGQSARKGIEY